MWQAKHFGSHSASTEGIKVVKMEPLGPTRFATRTVAGHIVSGSLWMVAWRWGVRLTGLASTLILARILTPTDFGIIAMAMVIVGFVEVLADTNANLTLIRTPNLERSHVDTAWTIQLLVGVAGCVLTSALSPLALVFFDGKWEVVFVIMFLSLKLVANAVVNVGAIAFQMNLDFAKDFRFGMYEKLFAFAIGVSSAFILKSYWALAIAVVASRFFSVALSYWMSSYRPRLDLSRRREIWSFSSWLTLLSVTRFLGSKVDEFLIGNRLGATGMGHYAVALDVSTAPTIELIQPSWRAVYPVFANLTGEPDRLKALYLDTFAVVFAIALPACLGVSAVAADAVSLLLGPQWHDSQTLVAILAACALPTILVEAVTTLLNVTSNSRTSAVLTIICTVALIPACLVGFAWGGIEGTAWGRLVALLALLPLILMFARKSLDITAFEYIARMWRPLIGASVMYAVVVLFQSLELGGLFPRLLASVGAGAVTYAVLLLALWSVSGRKAGFERWFVDQALALWRRVAS